MTILVTECNPAKTREPLATVDEDMLIASMRFPILPYNSNIITGDKLQMTTCFVLNKPQLVVRVSGELFLGHLVIKASLILKVGLIVEGSNMGPAFFVSSLFSEMSLAIQQLRYLLDYRPTGTGTKMSSHARMVLICRHRTMEKNSALSCLEEPTHKVGRVLVNFFQSREFLGIM
jgi:hypothetical protein